MKNLAEQMLAYYANCALHPLNYALAADIAATEEALEKAVALIKAWHNMPGKGSPLTDEQVEQMWQIYYNHSPEMKPIREALGEGAQQ